jgi:hypothetical protein
MPNLAKLGRYIRALCEGMRCCIKGAVRQAGCHSIKRMVDKWTSQRGALNRNQHEELRGFTLKTGLLLSASALAFLTSARGHAETAPASDPASPSAASGEPRTYGVDVSVTL